MPKVKGISIRQPWVDLILRGEKKLELRQSAPSEGWPDYLVIHSARMIEYTPAHFFGYRKPWTLPLGKLLALAKLERVVSINEKNWLDYLELHRVPFPAYGDFFGLELGEIKLFEKPVDYRGQLILFPIAEEIYNQTIVPLF